MRLYAHFLEQKKYIQNYVKIHVFGEYPRKTVSYVLSERKQLRKKSDMYYYVGSIALPLNLLADIQENKREKISHCS